MDLRNNQITVDELLANPASRKVLERRFPHMVGRPIVSAAGFMTLEQAMKLASAYVPQKLLQGALRELQRL